MTMYLPNRDVRPTGFEAGEFLEVPEVAPPTEPVGGADEVEVDREDDEADTR
jgi:hypothetical protein